MTSSTRIRFGALAAASAVVAGGFFAAVPANAAGTTLTATNTTFTVGDWGTGLDLTGTGFTPDGTVTVTLDSSVSGVLDQTTATADAAGDLAVSPAWIPAVPLAALAAGETLSVTATDDADTTLTANLPLTVDAAVQAPVPEPKGISTSVSTITTAELADPGIDVHAAGYTPGELVTITVDYNGSVQTLEPATAAADGTIDFNVFLLAGTAVAGSITITAVGTDSGVSNTATVEITGDDVPVDGNPGPIDLGSTETTTAADTAAPVANLPVVSG
ncbi:MULTISPECIES: hypothetical protein [unclassified Leifsonia]|uniref:hypothetical protein n=1 Tax=unclassified Leifsonia TaxID=2663824 RepID=UPI0008A7CCA4|nr:MULTISPECIES: hypothetical protein [unclassified Leifsonia]SEI12696.1 hypothetical protein SAMN04515694_11842 [Leifsonia sp. CL154]SFL96822.1 hypothetical protein SAMN04515692_11945 [Leifsonia sp. CL147]